MIKAHNLLTTWLHGFVTQSLV